MFSISDIRNCLTYDFVIEGNEKLVFDKISPIFEGDERSLSWIRAGRPDLDLMVRRSAASFIICESSYQPSSEFLSSKCFIKVEKPEIAFLRLVKNLYRVEGPGHRSVHPLAIVHPQAKIGTNTSIGPFSVVGECEIGDDCIIASNCVIGDGVSIRDRVFIGEFCNIGGQGFGHVKNEHGALENMLHIGRVVIEDDVEIFPYSNVDRATLSETRIGRGTKIDHYCHIGHNTRTGKDCIITAKVVLCGGSTVGNSCFLGVGSIIRDGLKVGDNVTLGMGAIVTKNIPDGEMWLGAPATEISRFRKNKAKSSDE